MYPVEKYQYYTDGHSKVIATSTYAGKTVRGIAKCAPGDEFDLEIGKKIAAARCAVRVAKKRLARATKKTDEAYEAMNRARHYRDEMVNYECDAEQSLATAEKYLTELTKQI